MCISGRFKLMAGSGGEVVQTKVIEGHEVN